MTRAACRHTRSSRPIDYPSSSSARVAAAPLSHLTEENQNRHGFKAGKDIRTAKGKNTGSNFKAGRDL